MSTWPLGPTHAWMKFGLPPWESAVGAAIAATAMMQAMLEINRARRLIELFPSVGHGPTLYRLPDFGNGGESPCPALRAGREVCRPGDEHVVRRSADVLEPHGEAVCRIDSDAG